jgi:hypothetical protein
VATRQSLATSEDGGQADPAHRMSSRCLLGALLILGCTTDQRVQFTNIEPDELRADTVRLDHTLLAPTPKRSRRDAEVLGSRRIANVS